MYSVGRLLRLAYSNLRARVPYENLPDTRRLVALCQVRTACMRLALGWAGGRVAGTQLAPGVEPLCGAASRADIHRGRALLSDTPQLRCAQDIYIARAAGELRLEGELYRALITVYRLPSLLFELTKKGG